MLSYPISNVRVGVGIKHYLADFPEQPSVIVDPDIDRDRPWVDQLRDDALVILQNRIRLNQMLPYPTSAAGCPLLHFSTTVQFKLLVYTEMKVRNLRKGYLASVTGTTPRAMSDVLNLRVPTRLETLERILQEMGVEASVKLVPLDGPA